MSFACKVSTSRGIDQLQLGSLRLVQASEEFIRDNKVQDPDDWLDRHLADMGDAPWLVGTFEGTEAAAAHQFQTQARLAVGMLAVAAAATHKFGASGFRIRAVFDAEDNHRSSSSLFWDETARSLGYSLSMANTHRFAINEAMSRDLLSADAVMHAFTVFEKAQPNEVETTIAKAVFWFADAHRDPVAVMRLIKYWSCVEGFFSVTKDDIAENLSIGLAAVLTFGGYGFLEPTDYQATKARIKNLYGHRSTAVHRASHDHVSESDVATLSQWTAWLIVNMIAFAKEGRASLKEILAIAREIDRTHTSPAADQQAAGA
jgi:hypothetical protein